MNKFNLLSRISTHKRKRCQKLCDMRACSKADITCGVCVVSFVRFDRGDFGRLGHGNSSDLFIPHPIMAIKGLEIKQIACGDSHCLAITADGDVHRCSYLPLLLTLNLKFYTSMG